jgi:CYTH domain-containing protein
MIELERTYLIKKIPENLKNCRFKEIIDVYFPKSSIHPKIRLRKNGDKFELTKKEPVNDDDLSELKEQTIIFTEKEFNELNKLEGKRIRKFRYYYEYEERIAEIDVFQDSLKGLILVDFEFSNIEEKNNFLMPDFCLAEVTQEEIFAGGIVCGKSFEDIEKDLMKFNYKKVFLG